MEKEFICCICFRTFEGFGNNPDPISVVKDARCCDECNGIVIQARINIVRSKNK